MNNRYFRLNPECFLTTGVERSVVQNLYTGQAMWMDADSTQVLLKAESNQPVDVAAPVLQQLSDKQWGFFSAQPTFVDKLRTFNIFREKRLWKETPYIGMAVLQVSNVCHRGCSDCRSAFCPICTVFPPCGREPLSIEEWRGLIAGLHRFGTRFLVFTGGEALLFPGLSTLVGDAASLGIGVQVHTSGLQPIPKDFPDVGFSILLTDATTLPAIAENFKGRRLVTILAMGVPPADLNGFLADGWNVRSVSAAQPSLSKQHLVETDFDRFFARKHNESCLNGKIYVAHDGAVFPCFGHRAPAVADIRKDGLGGAVQMLLEEYWNLPIDKIDLDRKCSRCEFRYCCSSCRYMDTNRGCSYDPDRGLWR